MLTRSIKVAESQETMQGLLKKINENRFSPPNVALSLDAALYHVLDTKKIPPGYAEVDIKLDDNGEEFEAAMTAGIVASAGFDSQDARLSNGGECDVIRPVPGWWMYTKRRVSRREGNMRALRKS